MILTSRAGDDVGPFLFGCLGSGTRTNEGKKQSPRLRRFVICRVSFFIGIGAGSPVAHLLDTWPEQPVSNGGALGVK